MLTKESQDMANLNEHQEYLHINLKGKKITGALKLYEVKQGSSRVLLIPALQMTGYGDTSEEAKEMIIESIDDFFKYLIKLPMKEISIELRTLGFKSSSLSNKKYERPFVDKAGDLHDLDVDDLEFVEESMMELS